MLLLARQYWFLLDRRARLQSAGLAVLALLTSVIEGLGIGLIFPLIKIVLEPSFILSNSILRWVYDTFGFSSTYTFTLAAVVLTFALVVLKNSLSFLNVYLQNQFAFRNEAKVSARLLAVYLYAPYVAVIGRASAELLQITNNRVFVTFRDGVLAFISVVTEGLVVLAVAIVLVVANPPIGLLAGGLLAIGVGGFYLVFRRRYTQIGQRDVELNKDNLLYLQQCIGISREIRILGRQEYFLERFRRVRAKMQETQLLHYALTQLPRIAIETVTVGAMLLVMLFMLIREGDVTEFMAMFGLFAAAAFRLMPSASKFLFYLGQIRRSRPSTELVYEDLRRWEDAANNLRREIGSPPLLLTRNLRVEGVSFRYAGAQHSVIENLALEIRRGESLALVGPSGGGKSTLIDILLGLLPPTSGRILLDDVDITTNLTGWRRQIGYVPQMPFLIDDTLARNIALGVPDTEIDPRRIARAIELSQLASVVSQLPEGIETRIGEQGTRMSGGQRQRIAIARALYHEPSVLILDEATSSLDNETEAELTRSIENLAGRITIIVIAHRLSTVRHCDRVALLSAGRVLDIGTFSDLTSRSAEMQKLVRLGELLPSAQ